ncbi:MAG: hypothetical protein C4524_03710 [Candidatus Zixiibacteriota bacterium]|nr:MAG: hypothetical protein C4524_03710 [candidate division Zixibacteria bacterium]
MNLNENLLSSLSEETNREMEQQAAPKAPRESRNPSLKRDFLAEDFRENVDNIYEAIIVMSQRARQIGQKQARVIELFLASKAKPDSDEVDDEAPAHRIEDEDEDAPRLPDFEKPTVLAMNELHKGYLKFRYKE